MAQPSEAGAVAFRLFGSVQTVRIQEHVLESQVQDARIRSTLDESSSTLKARRQAIQEVSVSGEDVRDAAKLSDRPRHGINSRCSQRQTQSLPEPVPSLAFLDAIPPPPPPPPAPVKASARAHESSHPKKRTLFQWPWDADTVPKLALKAVKPRKQRLSRRRRERIKRYRFGSP